MQPKQNGMIRFQDFQFMILNLLQEVSFYQVIQLQL